MQIRLTDKEARRADPDGLVVVVRPWSNSTSRVSLVRIVGRGADGKVLAEPLDPHLFVSHAKELKDIRIAARESLRWASKIGSTSRYAMKSRQRAVEKN